MACPALAWPGQALPLAWALVLAMAQVSPRHWPLAVLWGLLSRVLLLERIFF